MYRACVLLIYYLLTVVSSKYVLVETMNQVGSDYKNNPPAGLSKLFNGTDSVFYKYLTRVRDYNDDDDDDEISPHTILDSEEVSEWRKRLPKIVETLERKWGSDWYKRLPPKVSTPTPDPRLKTAPLCNSDEHRWNK